MAWYDNLKNSFGWGSIKGALGFDNIADAGDYIGGALDAPYNKKEEGYDAIRAETERLKGVRQGQKDFAYNLADSKYDPARRALDAVYGDPRSWKL